MGIVYCNPTFDSFLCWGPTPAGEEATQNCPTRRFSDITRLAYRRCGEFGNWLDRDSENSSKGWTNYTSCFPSEVRNLFGKVYGVNAQSTFDIAQRTRYLEIVGFSVSLIALLVSIGILTYFRTLRNFRTKIHLSLFVAMLFQVIVRLVIYIDQAFIRSALNNLSHGDAGVTGIDNMPYVCETSYVVLEYTITMVFIWMFIEGLHLNNLVTSNALKERIEFKVFFAVGWTVPLLITAVWATATGFHYRQESNNCWYGYNFLAIYWIVQAPRLSVIIVNVMFLLNIVRVLIVKIRRTTSNEIDTIRKAVRAALLLLPLLGITNILDMTEAPLDGEWRFAVWSYTTHFLRSFQGLFIALLYCFMNAEVRMVIMKCYQTKKAIREALDKSAASKTTNQRSTPVLRRIRTAFDSPIIRRPMHTHRCSVDEENPQRRLDMEDPGPISIETRAETHEMRTFREPEEIELSLCSSFSPEPIVPVHGRTPSPCSLVITPEIPTPPPPPQIRTPPPPLRGSMTPFCCSGNTQYRRRSTSLTPPDLLMRVSTSVSCLSCVTVENRMIDRPTQSRFSDSHCCLGCDTCI